MTKELPASKFIYRTDNIYWYMVDDENDLLIQSIINYIESESCVVNWTYGAGSNNLDCVFNYINSNTKLSFSFDTFMEESFKIFIHNVKVFPVSKISNFLIPFTTSKFHGFRKLKKSLIDKRSGIVAEQKTQTFKILNKFVDEMNK